MTLQELNELAEQSWEGCDGCDENNKYFWIKGFQSGYNRAIPDEISDEEIEKAAVKYKKNNVNKMAIEEIAFIDACKWYREQLKK
jgi:hypothetical protein